MKTRHSAETKAKIAASNRGKIFSEERKRNISESRKLRLTQEQEDKLLGFWDDKIVSDAQIVAALGISKTAYDRIKKELQGPEMPKFINHEITAENMYVIKRLGENSTYCKDIAKQVGASHRSVCSVLRRLGLVPNNHNPERRMNYSKLEDDVAAFFIDNNVKFERQFNVKKFYFDFRISGKSCLVEIHGDYWHGNPKIYKYAQLNDMQKSAWRRDFAKRQLAEDLGFKRIVVWEKSLRENRESTLQRLLEDVKNV